VWVWGFGVHKVYNFFHHSDKMLIFPYVIFHHFSQTICVSWVHKNFLKDWMVMPNILFLTINFLKIGGFLSPKLQFLCAKFIHLVFNVWQKYIKIWLKLFISCVAYNQIWLDLPKDDHHFFALFIYDPHFGYIRKTPWKTLMLNNLQREKGKIKSNLVGSY
jgi:hypothetical protein